MTKKEARAHKDAWNLALQEGRVIRMPNSQTFYSYPTVEETKEAFKMMLDQGIEAIIV